MEKAKMPIEIRKTIVTPTDDDHDVIQLHISDAPPDDESATLVVQILVKQPAMLAPALGQLQRAAMSAAQDVLTPLLQALAKELQQNGLGLYPPPKNPQR
jgi:hypothetical protein